MGVLNIKSPKNGYAYVYLSNESIEPVYFDNFKVQDNRGRIIEEDHYYSFGLKIAAISSKKLGDANEGSLKNDHLYNDKELWEEGDLNWYDYGFRNYDPQIGRFPQLDPLTDEYPELTPYQYGSNDPILNIDLDGLEGVVATVGTETGFVTAKSMMSDISYTVTKKAVVNAAAEGASFAASFFGGVGNSLWSGVKSVGNAVKTVVTNPGSSLKLASKIRQLKVPTFSQIGDAIEAKYDAFKKASPDQQAFMAGELFGDIAQLFVGPGIIKGSTKVVQIVQVVKEVEVVANTTKYTKSSLKLGQKMHKAYKAEDVVEDVAIKEFRKIPGIRPDFVDLATKTIYELKPLNPRAMKQGLKQLEKYKKLFEKKYGGIWKTVLDTY